MRVDIMVDIETLGTKSDSTIFQISAIAFDIKTGKYISEFNKIADVSKNKEMNVDGATIKWWLNTNKDLLTVLLNEGIEHSSDEIVSLFYQWITSQSYDMKNIYLWGNGILFDNKMIQHQMERIGLDYPIYYKNDRDMRTLLELTSMKAGVSESFIKEMHNNPMFTEHNAIDDVKYQIAVTVGCFNQITEVE